MVAKKESLELMTDKELAQLAQTVVEGDDEAFDRIMQIYSPYFYKLCLNFVHSKDKADDIHQEATIKMWEKMSQYDSSRTFIKWATAIYKNTAIDYLRKVKSRNNIHYVNNIDFSRYATPERTTSISEEERLDLEKGITSLPETPREVITVIYFRGYSLSETARLLGKPGGTIKSALSRGLNKLREKSELEKQIA